MTDVIDRGLAFVERCATEKDVTPLVEEFRQLIRDFGFDATAGGGWTGVGRQRQHRFYFNDWPADWMELYMREKFFEDDPYVLESLRRMSPFSWQETEKSQQTYQTARGKEIYKIARDYGWREVIGFPLHGPAGYQGLVSVASLKDVSFGPRQRGVLYAMAMSIHDRCRLEQGYGLPPGTLPDFSSREVEVLQWAALGKTDWEIGQLLGITEATAHFHVERAKKKLGVTSRVQAVAMVVLHGLV
jgi:LuxR family quorum sensing-dependent transcriptional regulator